jgi:hypothetical protein
MPTHVSIFPDSPPDSTDIWSIRRCSSFFIVLPYFVEIVLVQLPYKAGKIAVFEVFRKNGFCEFFVLRTSISHPIACTVVWEVRTSRTTKLSPSSPHLTTDAYVGSSSILNRYISIVHGGFSVFVSAWIQVLLTCTVCAPVRRSANLQKRIAAAPTHKVARVVGRSRGAGSIHCGSDNCCAKCPLL